MSRLVYLFGATTVLFAGLSVHLALQLRAERSLAGATHASAATPTTTSASASTGNVFSPGSAPSNLATSRGESADAGGGNADLHLDYPLAITVTNADREESRRQYVASEMRFL